MFGTADKSCGLSFITKTKKASSCQRYHCSLLPRRKDRQELHLKAG